MDIENTEYKIAPCKSCGNIGRQKILATYNQEWEDYCDGEPTMFARCAWILIECPICNQVSLLKLYSNDTMIDYNGDEYFEEEIVYPEKRKTFQHTPKDIVNAYEAAVDTLRVDLNISLTAIRRVLEMICKERGCTNGNLEKKLKDMVKKNILPTSLEKCGYLIRKFGNEGAHGNDELEINKYDLERLLDFIETIMYYIYELPVKIKRLNQKLEEREVDS